MGFAPDPFEGECPLCLQPNAPPEDWPGPCNEAAPAYNSLFHSPAHVTHGGDSSPAVLLLGRRENGRGSKEMLNGDSNFLGVGGMYGGEWGGLGGYGGRVESCGRLSEASVDSYRRATPV